MTENWSEELAQQGFGIAPVSHGRLSKPGTSAFARVRTLILRTQILAIDEGHRFLNHTSYRTAALGGTLADHVLVFTATPISRSARDLVGIVDLLGADNLEPEAVEVLERLWQRRKRANELDPDELAELRQELQRFTVRRTRQALNRLIDREPDAYRNALGQRCRYPEPDPHVYELGENDADREIARRVVEYATTLRGVFSLQRPIVLTDEARAAGWTEEQLVRARLGGAAALAKHHVLAALRSSRAALWEHVHGTRAARSQYAIREKVKSETGDMIGQLERLLARPAVADQPLAEHLPEWLREPEAWHATVRAELQCYTRIADEVAQLSARREESKAQLLASFAAAKRPTIAFDSRPITLALLRNLLRAEDPKCRILLATGGERTQRRHVEEAFALGPAPDPCPVALCSDSMSEGLNLQGGSIVVHLDMPSTVRQAEQRVGRIVRMDSPHARIDVYWPRDAEEFALRTDERFVQRVRLVEVLIGGNVDLPAELRDAGSELDDARPVSLDEVIHETAQAERDVDFDDAFSPVAALVDGPAALVDREVYERMRTSEVRVVSSVSVVRADTSWVFVAIRAAASGAPRWALVHDPSSPPTERDLSRVSSALRQRLGADTVDLTFDDDATARLDQALRTLSRHERLLLPPKKRRALDQMDDVLRRYRKDAQRDAERARVIDDLLRWLHPPDGEREVDLRDLSDGWLRAIRQRWGDRIEKRGPRRRPLMLRDLTASLKAEPLATDELRRAFADVRDDRPIYHRVVAAIVGRPDPS